MVAILHEISNCVNLLKCLISMDTIITFIAHFSFAPLQIEIFSNFSLSFDFAGTEKFINCPFFLSIQIRKSNYIYIYTYIYIYI